MHHVSRVSYGTGEKLTSTVFLIITLVLSSLPTLRWSACGLTTELLYITLSPRIYGLPVSASRVHSKTA